MEEQEDDLSPESSLLYHIFFSPPFSTRLAKKALVRSVKLFYLSPSDRILLPHWGYVDKVRNTQTAPVIGCSARSEELRSPVQLALSTCGF